MKMLLCRIAWAILWRWWPDRVYRKRGAMGASHIRMEWATLSQVDPKLTQVYEYLDHSGRSWVKTSEGVWQ